ncbi:MAG: SocA family protein [Candidatus Sungbacteria bacterium]|nr:SocA family protein [Candidatus Sungbacteria bacterium]
MVIASRAILKSMQYDLKKFINAVLFFAEKVDKLGITKLNKLLYYVDFEHFRLYGRPVLGDRYRRMEQGPVPELSYSTFNANFRDNQDSSLKELIDVVPETVFSFKRSKIIAKSHPDLSIFSKSEIDILKQVVEKWHNVNAREIVGQSHLERPWKETPDLAVIDYKLALDQQGSISHEYANYREKEDQMLEDALSA